MTSSSRVGSRVGVAVVDTVEISAQDPVFYLTATLVFALAGIPG